MVVVMMKMNGDHSNANLVTMMEIEGFDGGHDGNERKRCWSLMKINGHGGSHDENERKS